MITFTLNKLGDYTAKIGDNVIYSDLELPNYFDSIEESFLDRYKTDLAELFKDEEEIVDGYINEESHLSNYFIDPDYHELRNNIYDLLDCSSPLGRDDITDDMIDDLLVDAEFHTGNGYHTPSNAIWSACFYGQEYEYEIDLTKIHVLIIEALSPAQIADLADHLECNADDLLSGSITRYTQYTCTPAICLTDDQIYELDNGPEDQEPDPEILGPFKPAPEYLRNSFSVIDGGVKTSAFDALKARMKRWERNEKRINADRQQTNKSITRKL